MTPPEVPAKLGLEARFFALVYKAVPAIGRLAGRLDARASARIEGAYWILALLGTLPALRANLLFPTNWAAALVDDLARAGADNIFGWGAALAVVIIGAIALLRRQAWRFLAILPYGLVAAADSLPGHSIAGFQAAYAASAFAVFLSFVVAGRTRSAYFALYVVGLALGREIDPLLTWDRIATFVAVSIVASLIYETWRQNRTMLRELGRENFVALLGRTLSLWSPTILLIAGGLTLSQAMMRGAEELIYDGTFVERYCGVVGGPDDVAVPCPETGSSIAYDDIYRQVEAETPNGNIYTCFYAPFVTRPEGPIPAESFACPADTLARESLPDEVGLLPVVPVLSDAGPDPRRWPVERLPFEPSLDHSVARELQLTAQRMTDQLGKIDRAALDTSAGAGTEARRLFSVVPETPGIRIGTCEFPDIGCYIVNHLKWVLIDAYAGVRARTERAFVSQMQARADDIAAGVVGANTDVRDEIKVGATRWSDETRGSIAAMFTVYNVVNILTTLWLIVIAIKSFLYVFARVIFDRRTQVHVDLVDDDTPIREGRAADVQEVNIPGTYPYDIYYKSNYQPLGPAPRFSIPQPFASLLSRIRFGAWNLSHVPMPTDDHRGLMFNSVQADHLVDWEMEDGEEVIFSYGNFVAMNENVKLTTIVSLRVSSLLLGRFVFHAARCEGGSGRLILRTRGRPATAEQVRQSIPVGRLVAWNSFARFSVDSYLTRTDVFLNGFNLRRSDDAGDGRPAGILIVEADARDGGVLFGTLRFAKHFLLPI